MSKVKYLYPVASMSGKVNSKSNESLVHRGNSDYTYTLLCPRDFSKDPKSEQEAANQRNFGDAVRAYKQLRKIPFQYEAFLQRFQNYQFQARTNNQPCHANPYTYFLYLYRSGQI